MSAERAFEAVRLICPRCRRVEGGALRLAPLHEEGGGEARPGRLAGVDALRCANVHCRATYPVVDGIPILFPSPTTLDLDNAPLTDLLSPSTPALVSALSHQGPEGSLSLRYGRLGRSLWASFHDWFTPSMPPPMPLPPHGVTLMAWLDGGEVGVEPVSEAAPRALAGSGPGREAWEAASGPTLLLDAHLPSLQAAVRLAREGALSLPMPADAVRWRAARIEAPRRPAGAMAAVCCDIHDPPFEAEAFGSVVSPNLIDSVKTPYVMLGQCLALTKASGALTVTSPFSWRPSITSREDWLESLGPATASAEEVLEGLVRELSPGARRVGGARWPWWLRVTDPEASCYQRGVLRFDKGPAPEPR